MMIMNTNEMELFFLSILVLVVLFISLSLKFLVYNHKSKHALPKGANLPPGKTGWPIIGGANLPPGKTGWPIIGETLEFLNTGRKGEPQKFVNDRMKKFSPDIFRTGLFGESFAVLCGAPGNKFLFSNENKLVNSWWPKNVEKIFPSSQQTSVREESKRMRKLFPQFLKPEALQRYIGIMDSTAKRHFETSWDNKSEVIVFPLAKSYTFSLACRLFLSIDDPKCVDELGEPFGVLVSGIIGIPIDLPGTPFHRAIKAANFIRKELLTIIKQRKIDLADGKASATQDILSHMLQAVDDDGQFMNEKDIADKILGLLIGGHDTTSAAITFMVKYLAELPDIYQGVQKEQIEIAKSKADGEMLNWDDIQKMKYSWNVASEVLRLAPPLQGSFREAIIDFTYAGYTIPKGWKLYWTANTTHMNPTYFPNPEKFDPSRFEGNGPTPYTFVPFGGGPRMCPGKEYARLEILVFVHNIVTRYKWEKLFPDEKIIVDPMPMPGKRLPIRLQSHKV